MIFKPHIKPLGFKAYGSIPHLLGSRLGPGDHTCQIGHTRIATEKVRDKYDMVIVQEKLDGSACAVAKLNGQLIPLTRKGYSVWDSTYENHHQFGNWVIRNAHRFNKLLFEGERVVGGWLWMAHGTRYDLPHEPYVIFDIFRDGQRILFNELKDRAYFVELHLPHVLHLKNEPFSIGAMGVRFDGFPHGFHGAIDGPEGAVWRVERNDKVDFLVKYVYPSKVDGKYLPENNNNTIILNTFK